ncbi:PHP domain-containing protein [Bifidobacterium tsurumiense]|uniref:Putative metal-dependent phosphoesterase n=1 Tax=Bifidobacterium tsurumiense TaxID=356829 RepID=A0A087EJY2_9BIFI|nr:PHP domain-containing protein [Bifidobacterium tsurumiense]KFJ08083.1 putative metal-dependent phosphoesterase [Bifidobacterium tsurumiense]MDY4677629.1 PHP domain-containing protein [Bifidobacterium tsurumiense]MSS13026.1 PHP domain-containing protein [Bifidobacterium tsurumiense]
MVETDFSVLPPKSGWDLHCHTVFSDGTQSVEFMVHEAWRRMLHGVAITDHDTTAGWTAAQEAAERLGEPVVRGTEITAVDDGVSVHMLAFQYNPRSQHISRLFADTRKARLERTKKMVALISQDYPIDWDDVLAQVKEGERTTIGRPHIADALVAAGVYPNRSAAFAGIVSTRNRYYVPTPSPTTHEVVRAVGEAGGVCVIAHAGDPMRNRRLLSDAQIETLIDEGLDGLEVWHRGHDEFQRRRLLGIAKRHDLLVTGGSDWHGAGKPNVLGECLTDDDTVKEIVARGAISLAGVDAANLG